LPHVQLDTSGVVSLFFPTNDLKAVEGVPQNNLSRSNIAIKLNSVIATQFGFLVKTMQYSNLCF